MVSLRVFRLAFFLPFPLLILLTACEDQEDTHPPPESPCSPFVGSWAGYLEDVPLRMHLADQAGRLEGFVVLADSSLAETLAVQDGQCENSDTLQISLSCLAICARSLIGALVTADSLHGEY